MTANPDGASANIAREVVELDRAEVMRLLASVGHGAGGVHPRCAARDPPGQPPRRCRSGHRAHPAERHDFHRGAIKYRFGGVVVSYEAVDHYPVRRLGWSVVVTGLVPTITDPDQIARYEQRQHEMTK